MVARQRLPADVVEASRNRRLSIWRHNGLCGTVRFAQQGMQAILRADTTTRWAKLQAEQIIRDLNDLVILMKEREDPPNG